MNHFTNPKFWNYYNKLPKAIQKLADKNFNLLKANPNRPSLHLKNIGSFFPVRIGKRYRALAVEKDKNLIWFWIGNHSDYDNLINSQ